MLALSSAICLPATLKPLSDPNILSPPMPIKQIASVLLPSSSLLLMSFLLAQGIPALFTLLSSAVVKFLAPSPAIGPPASLKPLFGPNIIPSPTPAKETTFVLLPLSSP